MEFNFKFNFEIFLANESYPQTAAALNSNVNTPVHQWNNTPSMNQQQPPPYPHQQSAVQQQQVMQQQQQQQIPVQGPPSAGSFAQNGGSESSLSPRDWSVAQTNNISPAKYVQ